ncbi:hypothetical protein ACLOJK_007844 [Asimina triloba]
MKDVLDSSAAGGCGSAADGERWSFAWALRKMEEEDAIRWELLCTLDRMVARSVRLRRRRGGRTSWAAGRRCWLIARRRRAGCCWLRGVVDWANDCDGFVWIVAVGVWMPVDLLLLGFAAVGRKGRALVMEAVWSNGLDGVGQGQIYGCCLVGGPYGEGLLLERDDGKMGLGSCASGVGIALPDLRVEGAAAGSDGSCWVVSDGFGRGERTTLLAQDEWAAIVGGDDRPGETRTGGGCPDRICCEGGWTVEHGRKMEVMEHWIQCSVGAP